MLYNSILYRQERTKGIYLHELSRKLGIPSQRIIELLVQYGFVLNDLSLHYLKAEHLDVILKAYINSIKSLYKSDTKNFKNGKLYNERGSRNFFSKFIKQKSSFFSFQFEKAEEMVFREKLDDRLIVDYFWALLAKPIRLSYKLVYSDISENDSSRFLFNKYRYKIRIAIRKNNTIEDFRSHIKSILISSYYYIFSSEDEDSSTSASVKYFSRIKKSIREVLSFIDNQKFHKKWKITYKTSLVT